MARTGRRSWKKILLWAVGVAVVLFVLIQVIPYGRSSHSNPPAANTFQWTDPQAETIARTACYDCHSNETTWWWATNVAPFSWLVQHDVDGGRARLNFSDYTGEPPADEFRRVVQGGEMPPLQYTLIHSAAKLSDAQKQTLVQGYAAGRAAMNGSGASGSGGPTPTPAATASASPAGATAVIQRDCSSCHAPDPALAFRASSTAEAQALIDSMVQRGAQVPAQDRQTLIDYFTR